MDRTDFPAVAACSGVMAEGYLPAGSSQDDALVRAISAAAAISSPAQPIELVMVVTLPQDEAALWFFAPGTEVLASQLVERAGLNVDRIVSCRLAELVQRRR